MKFQHWNQTNKESPFRRQTSEKLLNVVAALIRKRSHRLFFHWFPSSNCSKCRSPKAAFQIHFQHFNSYKMKNVVGKRILHYLAFLIEFDLSVESADSKFSASKDNEKITSSINGTNHSCRWAGRSWGSGF